MIKLAKKLTTLLFVSLGIITFPFNVAHAESLTEEVETSEYTEDEDSQISSYDFETLEYDEKDAMVSLSLIYVDDAGIEEIIKTGYGFFVGDKEKAVYLITCNHIETNEKNLYLMQRI